MASSGTITDPVVEMRLRSQKPDGYPGESVLLVGRVRIKSSATIEAPDLTLRTIKQIVVSGYDSLPVRSGGPPSFYGSVTVAGSLMNSVRVRSFRGSIVPHTGTQHVGTAAGGTALVSFMILGA